MFLGSATLKRIIFFILLQFLFSGVVNAQFPKLSFQRIGVDQGLSQGSVFGIYQDSLGFMWFATADGLNRYDGYTFKTYRQQSNSVSSLKSNCFRNFLQSSDKNQLWISDTGPQELYRFNTSTGNFQLIYSGKSKVGFADILPFKEEGTAIWFVEQDNGIVCLNWITGKVIKHISLKKAINCRQNGIVCLNNKFAFLEPDNVLLFDPATGKTDRLLDSALIDKNSLFQGICRDGEHTLWIAGLHALIRFDLKTKECVVFKANEVKGMEALGITSIINIDERYLCLGTERSGLLIFDKQTTVFNAYTTDKTDPASLSSNRVASLLIDQSKNIWIGNDPYGLCKGNLKKEKFHHESDSPLSVGDLSSNFVKCFLQDNEIAYIGTYDKGLNVWNRKTNSYSYFLQESVPGETPMVIYAMDKDSKGNLWIATEKGVRFFDKKANKISIPALPAGINVIYSIKVMNDDSILLGLPTGLCLLTGHEKKYSTQLLMDEKDAEEIRGFATDPGSNIFVFTVGKIMALHQNNAMHKMELNTLFSYSASRVKCLHIDKKGIFWLGTENGLLKIKPNFALEKIYREQDGLPNSFIYGVEEDAKGNLWISTNKGISKLDAATQAFKNYDVSDGLQANEFNTGAHYKNQNGELFFGGVNGFNYFYPDSVTENKYLPKAVLTDFKLFDKEYVLDTAIEWKRRIDLSYTQNSISFEFAGLEYTSPEKNQYAYRLVGADNNWVIAGKKRYARYADLQPGNYIFEVKSSNNDGIWSLETVSIAICIQPPFWKTWYFITGSILFFIIIIFITIRYFTAKKYKLELREVQIEQSSRLKAIIETEEKERKRIARELHDGLGQMLSTARLTVSGLEESENEEDKSRIRKSLKIIDAACEEVRHISHNMMPGALIQMGLIPALDDLVETINASGQLEVDFNTNIKEPIGESVEIAIYRIVQEVCNNIIKHAKAKNIGITIFKNIQIIDIEIKDNGIGFSTELIDKSMGIGWKNIYSRISSLNGTIKVDSVINKGTTIKIQITA